MALPVSALRGVPQITPTAGNAPLTVHISLAVYFDTYTPHENGNQYIIRATCIRNGVMYYYDIFYGFSFNPSISLNYTFTEPGIYDVRFAATDRDEMYEEGLPESNHINVTVNGPPVLLVHGWHGDTSVWANLVSELDERNNTFWDFDYKQYNDQSPQFIAKLLKDYIESKRSENEYYGPIDIVCHSMGALVTRYYIEHDYRSEKVHQWIGIAPVNHGAALADLREIKSLTWTVRLLKLLWPHDPLPDPDEPAIIEMNTNSNTVNALRNSLRSDVKYRVISGYNPSHSAGFNPVFLGRTREKWNGKYYHTFNGDGIVANEQSILIGRDFDVYPLYGNLNGYSANKFTHENLPRNPLIVKKVVEYLENPASASSQFRPPSEHLPDESFDIDETGNHGYTTYNGEIQSSNYQVTNPGLFYVLDEWAGSTLQLIITSPSGQVMQPDIDPVLMYSNGSTFEQYGIYTNETGYWNVSVIGIDVPPGGEAYNLTVHSIIEIPAPSITHISPKQGKRGTTVKISSLAGTNFTTGSTINLTRAGEIIRMKQVNVTSPVKITGKFKIPASVATGKWNVSVTNSDGLSGTLVNGFKILA